MYVWLYGVLYELLSESTYSIVKRVDGRRDSSHPSGTWSNWIRAALGSIKHPGPVLISRLIRIISVVGIILNHRIAGYGSTEMQR